jgi:DNA-directed RNA polymerase specialized sigma24 family protein
MCRWARSGIHRSWKELIVSVNSDAIFVNGNRPTPLDRAAQAFCEICSRTDAPTLNGRTLGHGLPPRRISVRELVELLPLLQPVARDVVWRELVRLVRASGEPWPTVAVGLALPGLRTAAARLVRDYSGDPEDLDSELVTAFYEALAEADIDGPMVCAKLRATAYNQVRRMRYGAMAYAARTRDLDTLPEPSLTPAWDGHPDFVLASAVNASVITREEAELIGASRLDGTSLSAVAQRLGLPITTAWCRRKSAEARLTAWIKEDKSSS